MSHIDISTLNARQLEIATRLDEPLFVAAGAGSGKTFTLTKRIAYALSDGSGQNGRPYLDDLSQVLVITFTNAAARDIKEKVRSALREAGPEFRQHALEVDSAWISTIHGMCSRILRRHALDLGLDPEFKVASTNEVNAIYNQALEEVVGQAQHDAPRGSELAQAFREYGYGSNQASGLTGVLGIVDSLIAVAKATPGGFHALVVGPEPNLNEAMARALNEVEALGAQRGLSAKARESLVAARDSLAAYQALAPGERNAEAALAALEPIKLPRSSKAIAELLPSAKQCLAEARVEAALARSYPLTKALVQLAERTDSRFFELKSEASLLDNDDLITKALEAMERPEIRAQYEGRFRLVMVDEFQDTDERQLELIGILAGRDARHLCTVGDSQQSIYRFRGADVSVFQGRGASLPKEACIKMDTNYRSHADVLKLVDRVCDSATGGVVRDFMSLKPGRKAKEDTYVAQGLPRVSIELVQKVGRGGSDERSAVMAAAIADRLARYAAAGQAPGDMALLLGATSHADYYIDALRAQGLECVVSGGSTFTSAPEVQVMAALLHTLANWHDTQSGLFPLLESPMFGLDANDFVMLGTGLSRTTGMPVKRTIDRGLESMEFAGEQPVSQRLQRAHDILTHARERIATTSVADVCWEVVRASGWLGRLEREGSEGRAREANVIASIGYIRDLTQTMGLGAARAASEFDIWLQKSKIPPAALAGGSGGAVQIMTVHASKGLEFPVVAVAECWSVHADSGYVKSGKLGGDEGGRIVLLEPRLQKPSKPMGTLAKDLQKANDALGEPVVAEDVPADVDSLSLAEWDLALRERDPREEQEEKTRLLYVALTRAKEALVLGIAFDVSSKSGVSPELASRTLGALFGEDAMTGEDLPPAGESVLDYGGSEPAAVRHIVVQKDESGIYSPANNPADGTGSGGENPTTGIVSADAAEDNSAVISGVAAADPFLLFHAETPLPNSADGLWRSREGVYSYSSAHQQMLDSFQQSREADDTYDSRRGKAASSALPTRTEREQEEEGSPVLLDADKATNLGSAFHELAQGMVETGSYPSPARIERLAGYWHLSDRARARLNAALERWWGSDLRREVLTHDLVRAEVPFFSHVHSDFGEYVEGAIDLLATNAGSKEAFLVDYKTGDAGLDIDQIRERHRMQAHFYARVLMDQGFEQVVCSFVCVEREDAAGQPLVVRYRFDEEQQPAL